MYSNESNQPRNEMTQSHSKLQSAFRTLLLGAGAALALAATLTLTPTSVASSGAETNGDELGSLPGSGGGGTYASPFDSRPALMIEAPSIAEAQAAILGYQGSGEIETYDLPNGRWRLLIRGTVIVHLDESVLATREMGLGLHAVEGSTPIMTQLVIPQATMAPIRIMPGETLDLPIRRMQDAGLLNESACLRTFHPVHQGSSIRLTSGHGILSAALID